MIKAKLHSLITGAARWEDDITAHNRVPEDAARFSKEVLDDFRENVGRFKAETGGMFASSNDLQLIDTVYFDKFSKNTEGSFYYDVPSMTEVFRDWCAKGYTVRGIYHSHPAGVTQPSYHDISSAWLHMVFFETEEFYLPIFQPKENGHYTMYLYLVRKSGCALVVSLLYVITAVKGGYNYVPFRAWKKLYSIVDLENYRNAIDNASAEAETEKDTANSENKEEQTMNNSAAMVPHQEYFQKVSGLYPDHVLNKVIVCIGTGGARSYLESLARSGFRNFILMDHDVVSPSNIATQGVFVSEMGCKKVDVIRNMIMNINPAANVVCVDRFLDETMSDEEFKGYLDLFPGRIPTDFLICGCTDNFEAQKRSSFLALKYGTPYLAAMMYEGGAAAEIIFVYPGITESCPRCLLRSRFEMYENGFENNVTSAACPIFATEYMNAIKGYISLMLLMHNEAPGNPFADMLDKVKNRNFVQIRLTPNLNTTLGIDLFDRVLEAADRFTYFGEPLWIPQHPDRPEFGSDPCKLCGGTGDLTEFRSKWAEVDTRSVRFDDYTTTEKEAK